MVLVLVKVCANKRSKRRISVRSISEGIHHSKSYSGVSDREVRIWPKR